ncbi:MAG: XRE family transcriptional regulator [Actinomycetota bacterium]
MTADAAPGIEELVRTRLRGLRHANGMSLDDLAAASNVSASTISRVETGKRTLSLDLIVALATGLRVSLDTLLEPADDDDVVIRPAPQRRPGVTSWALSRPSASFQAVKERIEPDGPVRTPVVHPGYDWFFVLSGCVRLTLGDRIVLVEQGEAAEFDTMTPHAFAAEGGPAEILSIFDRGGHRAHVHTVDG